MAAIPRDTVAHQAVTAPNAGDFSADLVVTQLSSIERTLQKLGQQVQSIQHSLASVSKESREPPTKKLRPTRDIQTGGEDAPILMSPHEPYTSNEIIQSVINTFFAKCQNQPYSFFHEGHFRQRFEAADIPRHLILAMMATAIRFSTHPYFATDIQETAIGYANRSWKSAISDCLLTSRALDVDLVQTLGLLSLFDFTAGRSRHVGAWVKAGLAVRIAQDLGLMLDKPSNSSFADQEERRRVFWSVYLLDRFVACGRNKPHAILDSSCHVQLPCSDLVWEEGTPERTLTLEELANRSSSRLGTLGPFGQVIAAASILGRSSQYSLQDFNMRSRQSPWDPSSDFAAIEFDLLYLESHLGLHKPIQEIIPACSSPDFVIDQAKTTPAIFARVLFHLCYCLLNHPFLLRRRITSGQTAVPSSFLSRALSTGLQHAHQMIETLCTACEAGCEFNASFCSYSVMVATSIIAIHRLDGNEEMRTKSDNLLQEALAYLEKSAKSWANIANMVVLIRRILDRTAAIRHLAGSEPHIDALSPADTDMMWTVVDYNAVSSATLAELTIGNDQPDHGQWAADSNSWFDSFFETFSGANIGDLVNWDRMTDGSEHVGL